LALLAMPVLAGLGLPLRSRLAWLLGLIAVYVPLAGAGPSIVRAAVMGALIVIATLAGRRASRLYALALAAVVTLAIDPRIAADVGWQLSFAAVLGILLIASPLREAMLRVAGSRNPLPRGLAEGAAMTIAATLATAPLVAFHFGRLSTMTLIANLLALPAVAPAMWLGMLAAAAGQVPGLPVEALNHLEAPLLAYVAQVASWCGRPVWAYPHVRLGLVGLVGSYAGLALSTVAILCLARRRRLASLRTGLAADGPKTVAYRGFSAYRRRRAWLGGALAALLALTLLALGPPHRGGASAAPAAGLRVEVLDVGQGDAILLQPAAAPAILVDGGPPGDGLAEKLRAAGVERLGAAIVTHDQSDHAGGIEELLGRLPVHRLLYAEAGRRLLGEARAYGIDPRRFAAGDLLRAGRLRMEAIWPPPELLSEPLAGADPNQRALVLLARWRRFSMLLTADVEAESAPLDPGPVDVLKVAHHGSDDAGLDRLLDRTAPRLAVISVGEDNAYGHPTAATLATLAAHGIRLLRTDIDGTIVLDVRGGSVRVGTGD
jgi:competence protein ComEC